MWTHESSGLESSRRGTLLDDLGDWNRRNTLFDERRASAGTDVIGFDLDAALSPEADEADFRADEGGLMPAPSPDIKRKTTSEVLQQVGQVIEAAEQQYVRGRRRAGSRPKRLARNATGSATSTPQDTPKDPLRKCTGDDASVGWSLDEEERSDSTRRALSHHYKPAPQTFVEGRQPNLTLNSTDFDERESECTIVVDDSTLDSFKPDQNTDGPRRSRSNSLLTSHLAESSVSGRNPAPIQIVQRGSKIFARQADSVGGSVNADGGVARRAVGFDQGMASLLSTVRSRGDSKDTQIAGDARDLHMRDKAALGYGGFAEAEHLVQARAENDRLWHSNRSLLQWVKLMHKAVSTLDEEVATLSEANEDFFTLLKKERRKAADLRRMVACSKQSIVELEAKHARVVDGSLRAEREAKDRVDAVEESNRTLQERCRVISARSEKVEAEFARYKALKESPHGSTRRRSRSPNHRSKRSVGRGVAGGSGRGNDSALLHNRRHLLGSGDESSDGKEKNVQYVEVEVLTFENEKLRAQHAEGAARIKSLSAEIGESNRMVQALQARIADLESQRHAREMTRIHRSSKRLSSAPSTRMDAAMAAQGPEDRVAETAPHERPMGKLDDARRHSLQSLLGEHAASLALQILDLDTPRPSGSDASAAVSAGGGGGDSTVRQSPLHGEERNLADDACRVRSRFLSMPHHNQLDMAGQAGAEDALRAENKCLARELAAMRQLLESQTSKFNAGSKESVSSHTPLRSILQRDLAPLPADAAQHESVEQDKRTRVAWTTAGEAKHGDRQHGAVGSGRRHGFPLTVANRSFVLSRLAAQAPHAKMSRAMRSLGCLKSTFSSLSSRSRKLPVQFSAGTHESAR